MDLKEKTHYEKLAAAEIATDAELKKIHAAMSLLYHDDRKRGPSAAADLARMYEINEAWKVLGVPALRRQYDIELADDRARAKVEARSAEALRKKQARAPSVVKASAFGGAVRGAPAGPGATGAHSRPTAPMSTRVRPPWRATLFTLAAAVVFGISHAIMEHFEHGGVPRALWAFLGLLALPLNIVSFFLGLGGLVALLYGTCRYLWAR